MSYTLQYVNLSDEDMALVNEMRVPNTEEDTNMQEWIATAKETADTDLANFDNAMGVFLGKTRDNH